MPPRSAPVAPRRDVPLLRHRRHRLRALLSEPVSNVTGKTGPPREEEQEVREGGERRVGRRRQRFRKVVLGSPYEKTV